MADRAVRLVAIAGWVLLIAFALLVIRDFFRFTDTLVYVALDDGLINQSYMLAEHGRYGFISSPTTLGIPRHYGEVSYGPWYFYLAAGLIWVFGYSLELVRSIHLWVIVGAVAAAAWWFPRREAPVSALTFGLAALYCFSTAMWPMARPDSSVTAFAVLMVIAAGLAITTGRARYWFAAGLAAACGATAHLIAWSLIPAVLIVFAYWTWEHWQSRTSHKNRRFLHAIGALAAGGVLGVFLFYASFGFRLGDQLAMFASYRDLVSSPEGYWETLGTHFSIAFGYLRDWQQWGVVGILIAGWLSLAAMFRQPPAQRQRLFAYLLPPLVIWTAYLVSSGTYSNHHRAYAILPQVMSLWTAAALVMTWIELTAARARTAAAWITVAGTLLLCVQATRLIAWQVEQGDTKSELAGRWVSNTQYTDRLLGGLPAGATAWGAVIYGIETPDRLQLIQVSEGLILLKQIAPARRPEMFPDYLIWGYPEVRDNALRILRGGDSLLNEVAAVLSGARYRVAAIVSAPPYGVSRVYARTTAPARHDAIPQVHSYDAVSRNWRTRLGNQMPVTFNPVPAAAIRADYTEDAPAARANHTLTSTLPPGSYLLRAGIRPGAGESNRRMMAALPADALDQTFGEIGPRGDFAGYFADQSSVVLFVEHNGGPLFVSQFDDGAGAAIGDVEAYPVATAAGAAPLQRSPSREFTSEWTAVAGVRIQRDSARMLVEGNDSLAGYQVVGPAVAAGRDAAVTVDLELTVDAGKVCTGVLNGNQSKWIVPPDRLQPRLSFTMDQSERFFAVIANCSGSPGPASRFSLDRGRYTVEPRTLYTDRLMNEAFGGGQPQ
jgi:hypothetical protein